MTRLQELETSLLTTFLCNYTNVHEALDIWSAAQLLERTLGRVGQQFSIVDCGAACSYTSYSCKLSVVAIGLSSFLIYFTQFKLFCNMKATWFLQEEKLKASVIPRLVLFPVTHGDRFYPLTRSVLLFSTAVVQTLVASEIKLDNF